MAAISIVTRAQPLFSYLYIYIIYIHMCIKSKRDENWREETEATEAGPHESIRVSVSHPLIYRMYHPRCFSHPPLFSFNPSSFASQECKGRWREAILSVFPFSFAKFHPTFHLTGGEPLIYIHLISLSLL